MQGRRKFCIVFSTENTGFRRLSEELAIVVKVVTQPVYFIRVMPFNNNLSCQMCPDIGPDIHIYYATLR
jgi:hypothetical protein